MTDKINRTGDIREGQFERTRETGRANPPTEIDTYIESCRSHPSPQLTTTFKIPPAWRFDTSRRACSAARTGKDIREDQACLWNLLATLIPRTPFAIPEGKGVKILDIGCGAAESASPLVEYFKGAEKQHRVAYLGVDIEPRAIARAKTANWGCAECNFQIADATDFDSFANDEERFDVILVRHPGPMREPGLTEIWRRIAKEAMEHLSEKGVIIVTDYFCDEYRFMRHLFKEELGATEYLSGRNPFSRPFHQNLNRDNFVAIYGKAP